MYYLLYLLGFLPSLIWLLFYLRKDAHPEPNRMIIKIFFFGIVVAFLAIFFERGADYLFNFLKKQETLRSLLAIFLGGALIEEYLKYLVVRFGVYKSTELDEPFDLLLYMIISALGFAALENILVLTSYHPILTPDQAVKTMIGRFISATFLHALTSAIFGYFLILSFYRPKNKYFFFFTGLIIATSLHGVYNFSIIKLKDLLLPAIILIASALFVSYAIKKVKRLKSVCLIKPK